MFARRWEGTRGARPTGGEQTVNRDHLVEVWSRISELGRRDGHVVGVCSSCGEWTSVAVEPPISRGPRKGAARAPWPECRYCHGGRVIPPPCAVLAVRPAMRPRIPRGPAELDERIGLPWPGVDDVVRSSYDPRMSDAPDQTEPVEPEPDEPDDDDDAERTVPA